MRKIRDSQEKDKENHVCNVLSAYYRLLQDWKREYAPASPKDDVDPRFVEALMKSAYVEHLLECMITDAPKEKTYVFNIDEKYITEIKKIVDENTVPNKLNPLLR